MFRFASLLTLFGFTVLLLGAGCAPKPMDSADAETPEPMGDRAEIIGEPVAMSDLIRDGELTLEGAAASATLSVAEWMQLAATTPAEQEAAERLTSSGVYLGDSVPVIQMQPGDATGTALYATGQSVGDAFETEFLHRFADGGGRVDFAIVGPGAGGGRAMPSALRVAFFLNRPLTGNSVIVSLGDGSEPMSELARAELPDDFEPNARAHRFGIRYLPGTVTVLLNGEPVVEAAARLGGGPAEASITIDGTGSGHAYLLRWTFDSPE